jgi:general secretion pathway protein A
MQKTLKEIGYMVSVTGIYDMVTFNEMKRFQRDFGLRVDGSAGPRTRALLYQMAK